MKASNFAHEQSRTPLIILSSPVMPKVFAELERVVSKDPGVIVVQVRSWQEGLAKLRYHSRALFLFSIGSQEDLAEALQMLMRLRAEYADGTARTMAFSLTGSTRIETMLKQRGCAEVLEADVSIRALAFKVGRIMNLVEHSFRKAPRIHRVNDSHEVPAADSDSGAFVWTDALDLESDFWLTRRGFAPKQVMARWTLSLLGPAPSQGKWLPISGELDRWVWAPAQHDSAFNDPKGGRWVYSGREPEFSPHELRWQFGGESPDLSFFRDEMRVACRFRLTTEGMLEVARNSPAGKGFLRLILQTIDSQFKISADPTKFDMESQVRFYSEGESPGDPNKQVIPRSRPKLAPEWPEWNDNLAEGELPRTWEVTQENDAKTDVQVVSGNGKSHGARFVDLIGKRLVAEILDNFEFSGEDCEVRIRMPHSRPPLDFNFRGRIGVYDAKIKLMTIELVDATQEQLQSFYRIFSARQDSISQFLLSAKGASE